jgi:hypothetical protein
MCSFSCFLREGSEWLRQARGRAMASLVRFDESGRNRQLAKAGGRWCSLVFLRGGATVAAAVFVPSKTAGAPLSGGWLGGGL